MNSAFHSLTRGAILCLSGLCVLLSDTAHSCQIPVFRYALERWEPDLYEVLVLHRGELSAADQANLEKLKKTSVTQFDEEGFANIGVRAVDLDGDVLPEVKKLGEKLSDGEFPALVVRFPRRMGVLEPIWSEKLTKGSVLAVVDSPARVEIANRILDGECIVWVLIESGDKSADDAALETLKKTLREMEKVLKLPDTEVIERDEFFRPGVQVELKLKFSTLRISRENKAERVFISMLMGVESDLKDYVDKPIVVPVFGRGRGLYGLTGPGINEDTIAEACMVLTGPCSCTVKDLNPGVDLLLTVDWNGRVLGDAAPPQPLPGLPSLVDLSGEPDTAETSVEDFVDSGDEDVGECLTEPGEEDGTPKDPSLAFASTTSAEPPPSGLQQEVSVVPEEEPAEPVLSEEKGPDSGESSSTMIVPLAATVLVGLVVVLLGWLGMRSRQN